jgi:DNA-binding CsgD family transcriptional regulator
VQRAELFLRRFIEASRAAEPVRTLGDDPDGFEQAADSIPHRIAEAMEVDAARAPAGPTLINRRVFGSAACDAEGRVLAADAHFARWHAESRASFTVLNDLDKPQARVSLLIDDNGIAVAVARFARAREWPLDASVRACLESGAAQIAAIVRLPVEFDAAGLVTCRRVFGWTGLETRVAAGLIEGGDTRAAAQRAQVSYETARDALKSAMRKAGARRQGSFVSLCIRTESGEAPDAPLGPVLQDLFGLTLRQSEIVLLLADGLTRDEVAVVLNLTPSIVKAELKTVFAACLVDSVASLGRVVGQIGALVAMAHAVAVDIKRLPASRCACCRGEAGPGGSRSPIMVLRMLRLFCSCTAARPVATYRRTTCACCRGWACGRLRSTGRAMG